MSSKIKYIMLGVSLLTIGALVAVGSNNVVASAQDEPYWQATNPACTTAGKANGGVRVEWLKSANPAVSVYEILHRAHYVQTVNGHTSYQLINEQRFQVDGSKTSFQHSSLPGQNIQYTYFVKSGVSVSGQVKFGYYGQSNTTVVQQPQLSTPCLDVTYSQADDTPQGKTAVRMRWNPPIEGAYHQYRIARLDTHATGPYDVANAGSPGTEFYPGSQVSGYVDSSVGVSKPYSYWLDARNLVTGEQTRSQHPLHVLTSNHPPVASADNFTTREGVALRGNVLTNDYDIQDGPSHHLKAHLVSGASNGSVQLSLDGTFIYQPRSGWTGTDKFVYTANDDKGGSSAAVVTITVTAANRAPVIKSSTALR